MIFYYRIIFTVIILAVAVLFAISLNKILSLLEKRFSRKSLQIFMVFTLVVLMYLSTICISLVGDWSVMDTSFITSLCYFGLGWITTFSRRASINQAGLVAKFVSNNQYNHEFEVEFVTKQDPYFLASLIFLLICWGGSFVIAYI